MKMGKCVPKRRYIKIGRHTTYEDGIDRVFRNAGELPERKNTIFTIRRKFEIKNNNPLYMWTILSTYHHQELLPGSYTLTNHEKEFLQVLIVEET